MYLFLHRVLKPYRHVVVSYLQAGALVRERRAEESCYNAHDRLRHILLQNDVCMLTVTCIVAHL